MTQICGSSREPKWAKTPDLLICVTSASAPMERPSTPICVARPRAASTMAALVCCPFCMARPSRAGRPFSGKSDTDIETPENERSCYFAGVRGRTASENGRGRVMGEGPTGPCRAAWPCCEAGAGVALAVEVAVRADDREFRELQARVVVGRVAHVEAADVELLDALERGLQAGP